MKIATRTRAPLSGSPAGGNAPRAGKSHREELGDENPGKNEKPVSLSEFRHDGLAGRERRPGPRTGLRLARGVSEFRQAFALPARRAGKAKGPPGVSRAGWVGGLLGLARLERSNCRFEFHRGGNDRDAGRVGILAERHPQGAG